MQRLSQRKSGSFLLLLGNRSQARETAGLRRNIREFRLAHFYRIVSGCVRIDGFESKRKWEVSAVRQPPPGVGCCWVDPFRNWVSVSRGSGPGGAAGAVIERE
jgi:hypothetical protein